MPFEHKIKIQIETKNTCICVGVDPSPDILRAYAALHSKDSENGYSTMTVLELGKNWLTKFVEDLFAETHEQTIAFKPNSAFFDIYEIPGCVALRRLIELCHQHEIPCILDAKRGDIGNTSKAQAEHIFDQLGADATTLFAYMGRDSILPFKRDGKCLFVVCKSSNPGSHDLQTLRVAGKNTPLFMEVAKLVSFLALDAKPAPSSTTGPVYGLVMSANNPDLMEDVRRIVPPSIWFLAPGVGAQGGSLAATVRTGSIHDRDRPKEKCPYGIVIPISRGITDKFEFKKNIISYNQQLADVLTGKEVE